MVNLRAIANRATSTINPNIPAIWKASTGYTTGTAGKTVPSYAADVQLIVQAQALSKAEIQHIDAMNLSPCDRAVYVNGQVNAVDREAQTGGDLLVFEGRTWLVVAILEGFTTAGWCKIAVTQQNGS